MTHTGGYRCPVDLSLLSNGVTILPLGANLDYMLRQRSANFPPGERMIYCNGGYALLSLALERAAGTSFGELLQQRIFRPLGMLDTQLLPSDMELLPGLASLHFARPGGGYRRGIYSWESLGDGGIVSTVDDMLRWMAHLRGTFERAGDAGWDAMLAAPCYAGGATGNYGLGLMRGAYHGAGIIHHSGTAVGGLSQMLLLPQHGLDLILITNRSDAPAIELGNRVLDLLLEGQLTEVAAAPDAAAHAGLLAPGTRPRAACCTGLAHARASSRFPPSYRAGAAATV